VKADVILGALAMVAVALPVAAAEAPQTPPHLVLTYERLADAILALNGAEDEIVRSVLSVHHAAAVAAMQAGDTATAAAQVALFGTEGDNAMEGVRKRLQQGGHHHHATAEEQAKYDPGYVVVTKDAKQKILAAAAALRQARDDAGRKAAFAQFEALAEPLLQR
jgi:hypothetical protein